MTLCTSRKQQNINAHVITGHRAVITDLDVCNLTVQGTLLGTGGTTVHGASTIEQAAAILLPAAEIAETYDVFNGGILQQFPTAFANPASAWTLGASGFVSYNEFVVAPPTAVGTYLRWSNVWVARAADYEMHMSYVPTVNGAVFQVVIDGVPGPTLDTTVPGPVATTVVSLPVGPLTAGNHDVRLVLAVDGALGNVGIFGTHFELVQSAP